MSEVRETRVGIDVGHFDVVSRARRAEFPGEGSMGVESEKMKAEAGESDAMSLVFDGSSCERTV